MSQAVPAQDRAYALPYSNRTRKRLADSWLGSAQLRESTLHQISPYIGKMKSTMASALIKAFTKEGEVIYDPFCGSGTIALEAWALRRKIIANDLSPYAVALTSAKLFPITSVEEAYAEIDAAARRVEKVRADVDLRRIPKWVRAFFHPETLRETVAWCDTLKRRKSHFLLCCLLGILHHQRSGFLSYPCSHTTPYLREKRFPRGVYPELYEYRSVRDRLEKKVMRTLKRIPRINSETYRRCYMRDAAKFTPDMQVEAIITSPPYMRQLDYGRDNRLRLWFLNEPDWKSLDFSVSPTEAQFLDIFRRSLRLWQNVLSPTGVCVFVLGDSYSRQYNAPLPDVTVEIATKEVGGYSLIWRHTENIPHIRRVRRACSGNKSETIVVFRRR